MKPGDGSEGIEIRGEKQPLKVVHTRRPRDLVPQSAKIDDSVNHRLALYCITTGCGAKDVFIAVVPHFLKREGDPDLIHREDIPKIPYETPGQLRGDFSSD